MKRIRQWLLHWLGLDALELRLSFLEGNASAPAPNYTARMNALEARLLQVEQRRPALVSIGSSALEKRVEALEQSAPATSEPAQPGGAHAHAVSRRVPGAHLLLFALLLAGMAHAQNPPGGYTSGGSGSGLPAGPTSPNGVAQSLCSTPSGGVAGTATYCLAGIPPDARTTTTENILATDRARIVTFNNAAAISGSIPQAGSGAGTNADFTNNWFSKWCDIGTGTYTNTPTTSTFTIIGGGGGGVSSGNTTLSITTGQCYWIYSDNANYIAVPDAQAYSGANSFFVLPTNQLQVDSNTTLTANQTRWRRVYLPFQLTFTTVSFAMSGCAGGGHQGVAVYTADGATRLFTTGALTCGQQNDNIGSTSIGPGFFLYLWTSDNATDAFQCMPDTVNNSQNVFNMTTGEAGTANASAGGVPPAGALTLTPNASTVGQCNVLVKLGS